MLHTVYSNNHDILRHVLVSNLDDEEKSGKWGIFDEGCVVVPNDFCADTLKRQLADRSGVCAGVEFISLGKWLERLNLPKLKGGRNSSLSPWTIYRLLSQNGFDFVSRPGHERLKTYLIGNGSADIGAYLGESDKDIGEGEIAYRKRRLQIKCYDIARRIVQVFITYLRYRPDWVFDWIDGRHESRNAMPYADMEFDDGSVVTASRMQDGDFLREQEVMGKSPDARWQKDLWLELIKDEKAGRNVKRMMDRLRDAVSGKLDFTHIEGRRPVHVFLPKSFPPIALPVIKAMAEKEGTPPVWLYIANPSHDYWFEPQRKEVLDADIAIKGGSGLEYLRKNAAATRAMIDRLWTFANHGEDILSENARKNIHDSKNVLPNAGDFVRPERLRLGDSADLLNLSFDVPGETLLARARRAILENNDSYLPSCIEEGDDSVQFVKAPNALREVQALSNRLYELFKKGIKPEDVCVAVTDLNLYTPLIDAVFKNLEKPIAWNIISRSIDKENLTIEAAIKLGNFLCGRDSLDEFIELIELPAVTEHWGFTTKDTGTIRNWLASAGYRRGIRMHAGNDDGTLYKAVQRLTLGYAIDSTGRTVVGDMLAVGGTGGMFSEDIAGNRQLWEKLAALCGRIFYFQKELSGTPKEIGATYQMVRSMFGVMFGTESQTPGMSDVYAELRHHMNALGQSFDADYRMDFRLYWHGFVVPILERRSPVYVKSAVTFAPIDAVRANSFKVVAVLGLGADSSFPGKNKTEEFDLMQFRDQEGNTLKRRGDGDSRRDNRNAFFDLFLAAGEYFIASYVVGEKAVGNAMGERTKVQEKLPSPVLSDLAVFLRTRAARLDAAEGGKDHRDAFDEKLYVTVPLSETSVADFMPVGARTWMSHDARLCEAVRSALLTDKEDMPQFCDATPDEVNPRKKNFRIEWPDLVEFVKDPGKWAAKKCSLPSEKTVEEVSSESISPSGDALDKYKRRSAIVGMLRDGLSREEVERIVWATPVYGDRSIRKTVMSAEMEHYTSCIDLFRQETGDDSEGVVMAPSVVGNFGGYAPDIVMHKYQAWQTDAGFKTVDLAVSNAEKYAAIMKPLYLMAADEPVSAFRAVFVADDKHALRNFDESAFNIGSTGARAALGALSTLCRCFMEVTPVLYRYKNDGAGHELANLLWRGIPDSEGVLPEPPAGVGNKKGPGEIENFCIWVADTVRQVLDRLKFLQAEGKIRTGVSADGKAIKTAIDSLEIALDRLESYGIGEGANNTKSEKDE